MNEIVKRRSIEHTRANEDEGIIEGYIAKWGVVDSYQSTFLPGAFSKTIENRTDKIRLLFEHDQKNTVGKLLDIREDNTGVFVRAKMNMDTKAGKEVFYKAKNGDFDCFSFGFNNVRSTHENGIEKISGLDLIEVSLVAFEASGESKITDVRSVDFNHDLHVKNLSGDGDKLKFTLIDTLADIDYTSSDKIALAKRAIKEFGKKYVKWIKEVNDFDASSMINTFDAGYRSMVNDALEATKHDLTEDDISNLMQHRAIDEPDKLQVFTPELIKAYTDKRNDNFELLCDELRSGFNPAETSRIHHLLERNKPEIVEEKEAPELVYLKDFRKLLTEDK